MSVIAAEPTLVFALGWRRDLVRDVILICLFSGFIALSSRIVIPLPLTPVPLTGQSFAVLLTGALLGSRLGPVAVLLYLVEGAAGLPVFFGGSSGPGHLAGPTGGYLVGFALAAWVVGGLAERGYDRRYASSLLMMAGAQLVIYLCGLVWLSRFVLPEQVLRLGLFPFLVGDALKLGLASACLPWAWRVVRR